MEIKWGMIWEVKLSMVEKLFISLFTLPQTNFLGGSKLVVKHLKNLSREGISFMGHKYQVMESGTPFGGKMSTNKARL
jgi:hypothetical protein